MNVKVNWIIEDHVIINFNNLLVVLKILISKPHSPNKGTNFFKLTDLQIFPYLSEIFAG